LFFESPVRPTWLPPVPGFVEVFALSVVADGVPLPLALPVALPETLPVVLPVEAAGGVVAVVLEEEADPDGEVGAVDVVDEGGVVVVVELLLDEGV
jgi:hypothetical protein